MILLELVKQKKPEQQKSENQVVAKEFVQHHKTDNSSKTNGASKIRLTSPCFLASKSDIAALDDESICYAIVCKEVLFSFEDMPPSLPPSVADVLQEFADVFPCAVPPGLPPIQGIEYQIDLIPGASLPNRAPYRTNLV